MQGRIAKLQRYATKDGPGIRTTVFMMGCNLRCLWCANPEMLEVQGSVFYYKERCQQCGICVSKSTNHAITLGEVGCDIDRTRCGDLTPMIDACPFEAYEATGKRMDSETLVKQLLKDKAFYEESNGGVTFSGGEAALQPDFIYECAKRLQTEGVHTALDTAGLIDTEVLLRLCEVFDLVLFDIKAFDNAIHKRCTGVDNHLILRNAQALSNIQQPMFIRFIVVPNMNDDEVDIQNRISFIHSLGECVKQVDLLPYHNLGEGKYDKLGMQYALHDLPTIEEARLLKIKQDAQVFIKNITIGG